jgi:hypothetical protein
VQHNVYVLRLLCSLEKLALCLDLVLEGGSSAQCIGLLSGVKLDLWLSA